jgi:hypothetical protein
MGRGAILLVGFGLWWAMLVLGLKAITLDAGALPVDYASYAAAAERMQATGSPYIDTEGARARLREMHEAARAFFETGAQGTVPVSGPYLYPPSLARALPSAPLFLAILTLAAMALCLAWWRLAGAGAVWALAAMAGSIDLIASFLGGNVEILLIALALLGCWLLWREHPILAAVPIAATVLVKPPFALLFVAFAGLKWLSSTRRGFRSVAWTVAAVLALVALEVLRWPEAALADVAAYLSDPAAFQYFALPPEEQWPMRLWNRAPLQVFLTLGLPYPAAQGAALAAFGGAFLLVLRALRRHPPGFAIAFALAYGLLLVGRPITWSMPLLGAFVLTAAWTGLPQGGRRWLALAVLALGLSHWAAFAMFAAGLWPGLLTLQHPSLPWETVVVLPGALLVLVGVARRQRATGPG